MVPVLSMVQSFLDELEREGHSTARLLERVPADHLAWRPHPRSSMLGDLAWHVATLPARVTELVKRGAYDLSMAQQETCGGNDFAAEHRKSIEIARRLLLGYDESALAQPFTITHTGTTLVNMQVAGAIRTIMLNHLYHHRGQLTVYLRMLDVPLPVLYANTADEKY